MAKYFGLDRLESMDDFRLLYSFNNPELLGATIDDECALEYGSQHLRPRTLWQNNRIEGRSPQR